MPANSNFFAACTTLEELKTTYRQLALRWHPDRPNGDTATMQQINAQYHAALKAHDGTQRTNTATGETYAYTYKYSEEQEIIDMIAKTLALRVLEDGKHDFWLIGRWLWIMGDTRPIKDRLKPLGYRWHPARHAWFWRPANSKPVFHSDASLDELAQKYGYANVTPPDRRNVPA